MFIRKWVRSKYFPAALCLIFALACIMFVKMYVKLVPEIDETFFFSSDDPQLQAANEIKKLFIPQPQVIFVASGNIRNRKYLDTLAQLTFDLQHTKGIVDVKSLGAGPSSVNGAIKSPLWRRLLVNADETASNLVIGLKVEDQYLCIETLKKLQKKYDTDDFKLALTGVPFVIHEIKRQLVDELKVFSTVAFIVFTIFLLLIFRSYWMLAGCIIACIASVLVDFIVLDFFGIEPGILTANLWSIVFVLTISHIVFMTGSWEIEVRSGLVSDKQAISNAVFGTAPASFWAMVTTLLGFLSLLLVSAKPLQQFGLAGAIGALASIFSAYIIFPQFLKIMKHPNKVESELLTKIRNYVTTPQKKIVIFMFLLVLLVFPGMYFIDANPTLFSYFKSGSRLRDDLEKVDKDGGTSPLEIVIQDPNGEKFNTNKAYKKLWELQFDYEEDPAVGTVISLPVIMGEAAVSPFAPYFQWDFLLDLISGPMFDKAGKFFITSDYKYGRFMIRMRETERTHSRDDVIERLKKITIKRGFDPFLVGGLYQFQGQLSALLSASILQGLIGLGILFSIIVLIVSFSIKISIPMMVCLGVIPVCLFGIVGYFSFPLDVVSSPGANIAIAIGIDSMIHLVMRVRVLIKENIIKPAAVWTEAVNILLKPVLASSLMMGVGFATFGLSSFPPTQRLGLMVVLGTLLSVIITLIVLPYLVQIKIRKNKKA